MGTLASHVGLFQFFFRGDSISLFSNFFSRSFFSFRCGGSCPFLPWYGILGLPGDFLALARGLVVSGPLVEDHNDSFCSSLLDLTHIEFAV